MSDDTVHLPSLVGVLFDLPRSEARRLVAEGAVKVKRDGQEIPLRDLDYAPEKLAGQTITLGGDREAQVPE